MKEKLEAANKKQRKAQSPPSGSPAPHAPPVVHKPTIQEDLSFPSQSVSSSAKPVLGRDFEFDPKRVGELLEVWLFLNMYGEPLILDSFTFDDFVAALNYQDEDNECTLINEIHCALLSVLIDEAGELTITLPERPQEDDESLDERKLKQNTEENRLKTESQEPESLNPNEAANEDIGSTELKEEEETNALRADQSPSATPSSPLSPEPTDNAEAYTMFKGSSWQDRLKKKLFKDGGWQQIIVGLLHTVSYVTEWHTTINEVLTILAPLDAPVTLATVHEQYQHISLPLRIQILKILCHLLNGSTLIRLYIEKCMDETTRLRKERMDILREEKLTQETIKALLEEKKSLMPQDPAATESNNDDDSESDQPKRVHRLRKRPVEDAETALARQNPAFKKVLVSLETANNRVKELSEANSRTSDEMVRLDCQRARMLGKDRFCNRYWWFESNGVRPVEIEEDDTSSSEDLAKVWSYSTGRLWVQGPSQEDAEVFLRMSKNEPEIKLESKNGEIVSISDQTDGSEQVRVLKDAYGAYPSDLSAVERKRVEEEDGFLSSMDDWGYYQKPEEIESLTEWLNPFGKRESILLKAISTLRQEIEDSMIARTRYLQNAEQEMQQELKKIIGNDKVEDDEEIEESEEEKEKDEEQKEQEVEKEKEEEEEEEEEEQKEKENGNSNESETGDIESNGRKRRFEDDDNELNGYDNGGRRRSLRIRRASAQSQEVNGNEAPDKRSTRGSAAHLELEQRQEAEKNRIKEEKSKNEQLEIEAQQRQKEIEELTKHIKPRVVRWTNEYAIQVLGHSHYDSSKRRYKKRK